MEMFVYFRSSRCTDQRVTNRIEIDTTNNFFFSLVCSVFSINIPLMRILLKIKFSLFWLTLILDGKKWTLVVSIIVNLAEMYYNKTAILMVHILCSFFF